MQTLLLLLGLVLALALAGLTGLRLWDARADRAEWRRLAEVQPADGQYSPDLVDGLPEPVQRYFRFAIRPGAPLRTVAEIDMGGQFALGPKAAPGYRPMQADQILAAPHGFVWQARMPGAVPISGSDSSHWTRFRIFGLVPVARSGGTDDHRRSAFGRLVAEAALWTPAALLPGPGIAWEAPDPLTARVTVSRADLSQAVDIRLDGEGRPVKVSMQRWSDANPDKAFRTQPFGAFPSDFREVEGQVLPFRVEAGNMFGTEDYFPFFRAEVRSIRFPQAPARR